MSYVCGAGIAAGVEFPDTGGECCYGAAIYGPDRCTCWEPVFELDQLPPIVDAETTARSEMCPDCAYRPGSPELADPHIRPDLLASPAGERPFWCHQGMRAPVAWVHPPTGMRIDGDPARDYRPPMVDDRPYRADGQPAEICAGWAVRHRKATIR